MPDIKDIIGNIFISPLTDIIYEYAKCQYCAYIKLYLNKNGNIAYKYPLSTWVGTSTNAIDTIKISTMNDKMHLCVYYDDANSQKQPDMREIDILLSIDKLAYCLAHFDICDINNVEITHMNHTDMPINMNFVVSLMLSSIGFRITMPP